MSDAAHDVIVIGGGPGGYAAALYGASAGLDVAVVEKDKVGGTCLHVGCIPAKELLEAASVYRTVARAAEFGVGAGEPSLDWSSVLDRKQQVIDKMMAGLSS
ncbi:MAG: FAD-binding protein, partial [Acidimicrobiaceae bacterium]|nr:FAD-binding protein [Acidimicrobiaceae bacterium]